MKDVVKKYRTGITAVIIEVVLVIAVLCEAFIGDYGPAVGGALIVLIWGCVIVTLVDVWRNWKR